MKSSFPHPIRRILTGSIAAALVALIPLGPTARAAGGSWNIDAAGNWSATANWTPVAVPGTAAGDVVNLLFNISAARTVTIDTTSRSVGDLNIGDPTATFGAYTLAASGGAVLNLDGTGTADATIDFTGGIGNTISAPITLVDNGVIRSNVAFIQTLSGVISGAGKTLTYNNDTNGVGNPATALQGQFLVTGNNTYTGGTTVSDVRVNITTNNTALGAAGSAVTIQNGGQVFASTALATINYAFNIAGNGWAETVAGQPFGALRLDGGSIVTGPVVMSANAAIGSGGTGTVSGVVSGGFTLSKRGAGTLTLSGANTYSNGTILDGASGSILVLGNATAAGSGAITWASGTLARLRVTGGVTIANPITIPAGLVGVANTGLLEQTGTGLATYNGPITISGSTTNGGHIFGSNTVGNEIVLGGAITSSVAVVQRDGRVIYKGSGTGYTALSVSGTALVGATNGIASTASVTLGVALPATLELNGFDQQLAGLTLAFNTTTALGAKTLTLTGNLSALSSGTHAITGTGAIALGANAATFTVADGAAVNDLTIGSLISGSAGFSKAGAGTLILNGNVTNTGTLAVTGGTLGGNTALSGALTVSAGAALQPGTSSSVGTVSAASVTFDVGATTLNMDVGAGGDFISTGALVTNGTATVNAFQLGGILANGTYNLIGYTGTSPGVTGFSLAPVGHALATLVDTGTAIALQVTGNDQVIWDGTNTTSWVTGVTQNWKRLSNLAGADYIESDDVIFQDLPTNSSVDIPVNVAPSKVSFTNTVATTYAVTGAGGIVGTTGLTKTGDGTTTLRTQNSYTGATTVGAGILELDHDATGNQVLTASSGVSIAPIATLRLTRDDGAFTYSRNTTGTGFLDVNPHSVIGGVVAHAVSFTGDNSGFTGSLRLLAPLTGTYRLATPTVAQLGAGTVEVQSGAQIFVSGAVTYNNPIIISGTGFSEGAGGNIGALRLDAGAVWAGNIAVNGTARIGSHNSTGTISGNISGGDVEFNAANFNNAYTTILTGTNTYGTTTIGGQNIQVAGVPSMRVNIGNGGTTGTLGSGNVIINGDGANGMLGFDRSNGYTLLPGQTITGAVGAGTIANSITRTFIDIDTLGTGFNTNGNAITLGAATTTTGGNIRVAVARAGAVMNIDSIVTTGRFLNGSVFLGTTNLNSGAVLNVGTLNTAVAAAATGSVLNINSGATLNADYVTAGEFASGGGTVNQAPGSTVSIISQLRAGHFSTETSTYNMSGGTLTLTGASPNLTPSTPTGGGANATGDNNINALVTQTIVGGGIYLGIDGTGVFNHTGGTVTTNWIVLDNRTDTGGGANMDGIDKYSISGAGSVLALRSTWGLVQRNTTSLVTFGGGTVRVDNGGTGTGTGANIVIPLDATIDTVASTTTTLDTNAAVNTGNGLSLLRDVRGTGTLALAGGGTVNVTAAAQQVISASISGSTNLTKLGNGTTSLTGSGAGYTGAVNITAGQLFVPSDLAAASITLADATTLGGEPSVGTLALGTSVRADVVFNPNTAGALTAGALAVNAASAILGFSEAPTGAGPWTAINYTTKSGPGSFGLLNSGSYRNAPAVTDTGSSITVNVTGTKALTWTGTGAVTTVWDNNVNANWVDTTPAADNFFAGDTVTFGDGPSVVNITVTSGVSPWKTTVNSNTNNYNLISTVSGIAGPGSLEKTGSSTLTLTGPNTYSGRTIVGGGIVTIATPTSLGSGVAGNSVTIRGGGRLSNNASIALDLGVNRSIAVGTGGGSISHNNATAVGITIPGNLTGSGSDNLSFHSAAAGAGTFILSGYNSGFTGNISVDAPAAVAGGLTALRIAYQAAAPAGGSITLNYPAAGANGNATTLDLPGITLPAGVTLRMTSFLTPGSLSLRTQVTPSGVVAINGPITLAGTSIVQITAAAGSVVTYNGAIGETTPGSFVESVSPALPFSNVLFFRGTGTHIFNQPINLPSAGSTISVTDGATAIVNSTGNVWRSSASVFGTLRIGVNDALPTTARLIIGQAGDQAATLDLNGFNQTVAGLEWAAPTGNLLTKGISNSHPSATSTFTINQATAPAATTFNGTFSGRTNLVKDGAANVTLQAAASNFTGNVTVNAGILLATSLGTANGSAGTLGAANVVGKTITVNPTGILSFTSNNIFGNGVGNANLPSTIVNGATLSSTRYNVLGNLTLNAGTLTQAATDTGNYEGFQFRGSVTVGGAAPSTITTTNAKPNHLGANTVFDVANVTGDASDDLTVSAPLRNQSGDFALAAGALTKNGLGTMTLSAANIFTGGVTVNGGTLKITGTDQSSNRLVANTLVTVNPGGVFETADVTNNTAPGTFAIDLALAGGTYRLTGAANNHQHIRNVSFTAGGTVETQGAVGNYVGTNAQLNGDVTVSGAVPATIAMQNGLGINGSHTFTVADVTGNANPDLTFTGTGIQQSDAAAGVVVKAGTGTLAINGPSSYTGGLSINAGTVSVLSDTALGGAVATVAINNGAKLEATGPVTSVRTFILGLGGGKLDTNGQTVLLDTAGLVTGTALEKTGAGTLNLKATQTYGALTTTAGTTNIYSAVGSGASSVTANATTNIYASQTLASLTIGAGAEVVFGDGLPFAPEPEKGGSFNAPLAPQAAGDLVPEPGSIGLLAVGSLGLLARRRRAGQAAA